MKQIIIFIIFFLTLSIVYAQNLSDFQQQKVSEYQQLAEQSENSGDKNTAANYHIKIGNIYRQARMTEQAISEFEIALNLLQNSTNTNAKVQINNYLAMLYRSKNDYASSEKYFKNTYNLIKDYGSRQQIASALFNIAQSQQNQAKYKDAAKNYDEALTIFLELDDMNNIKTTAFKLADCYNKLGDEQNYLKYYNLYVSFDKKIKDLQLQEKEKEVLMQSQIARQKDLKLQLEQYKNKVIADSLKLQQELTEKKQQEIEKQNIAIQQKEAQLRHEKELSAKQREINILLIAVVVLVLGGFVFIFRLFLINRRQKDRLKNLYDELQKKNNEIEKHRNELQKKNKQITDSINYASRIQKAILPIQEFIFQSFREVFIFYLPRDVVSGDFYWFSQIGENKIIAAIDCTGHSVPGAFMSMIANTLLNEVVKAKKNTDLPFILDYLNKEIIATLHSRNEDDAVNDGMDISIFNIREKERKAYFAAANHFSVVYIDGKKEVLTGDFYSIGGFTETERAKFTVKEINLGKNAEIYMFSDGFPDQFNEKGRKFMSRNFISLIDKIYTKPMNEQKKIIEQTFFDWKGNFRQIDDVLVIGIRV